jgi:hypothetical protein
MKKKRLVLRHETLRQLSAIDLAVPRGGVTVNTQNEADGCQAPLVAKGSVACA